ncbi:MAG: hypothetical protein K0S53_2413 [Bacteroidetes bacterium]|jgi:hypothetical protein|nr:hypothetical protein [Bacteroidota bacterium]MDF2451096.1 hypothetical protein [Bacteroidota bacterium]
MNKLLFPLLILFCKTSAFSQCVADGPRNATTFTTNASVGTNNWSAVTNVKFSDNQRSVSSAFVGVLTTINSNYLVETGFGFAVPVTATICGIQVDAERRQQGVGVGSSVKDNTVKIVKNGVILGSEHASGANWPGSDSYISYGGPGDLWGTTWTPADINASDFGVAYSISCLNSGLAGLFLSAELDHVQVTVYYVGSVLPVDLIEFHPVCQKNKVVDLKWSVASQGNNDYFTIERSHDGLNFEHVGQVDGGGTTHESKQYALRDDKPYEGLSYYRLQQTDFDGQSKNFEIVSINCDFNSGKIAPNPSSGIFTIEATGDLTIYNRNGDKVYFKENISGKTRIDMQSQPYGVYFYQLTSNNEIIASGKLLIH